jgi:phosphoribosyl 1,2-cyclic phosphodiesterase
MYLNILATGSSGNCSFIESGNNIVFIDIGISFRKLSELVNLERFLNKNIYLFITHEHSDHITGLKTFQDKLKPVILTGEGTADVLKNKRIDVNNFFILKKDKIYNINGFKVAPFHTPHDALEPLGYKFFFDDKNITFATDLGVCPNYLIDYFNDNDLLVLESNYEDTLLYNGKYHKSLKRRISSLKGHLSNKEVFNIISKMNTSNIKKIYLGHISEDNNDYNILDRYVSMSKEYFFVDISYVKQRDSVLDIEL